MFRVTPLRIAILTFLLLGSTTAVAQTTFYPANGVFNGFNGQVNIGECDNNNSKEVALTVTVTNSTGEVLAVRENVIPPNGSWHFILNDMADIRDKYGLYTLALRSSHQARGNKLHCRTSFYRPALPGSPKPFEYAYIMNVENARQGILGGVFNWGDPSGGTNYTQNWVSVINYDKKVFNASVKVYVADGTLADTIPIQNLQKNQRMDVGVGNPSTQMTGYWEVVPTNPNQKYEAFAIRYGPDGVGGFRFAFPMKGITGVCSGEPLPASTMGNGLTDNFLEIGNASGIPVPITIEVRNRDGVKLLSQDAEVPGHGKYDFALSPIIDPPRTGNVGSVRVLCDDSRDQLIVQSVFYGGSPGVPKDWAYASLARGFSPADRNSELVASVNTFAGMANWLKLGDAGGSGGKTNFKLYDYTGALKAEGENDIAKNGSVDQGLHTAMGPDSVGSIVQTTSSSSLKFTGEMLRVTNRSDNGQIGLIVPSPAVVRQKGDSDGGFLGDPQSLAGYKENLAIGEAKRLLTTTSFGGGKAALDKILADGLSKTVDDMLACTTVSNTLRAEAEAWLDGDEDSAAPQGSITQDGVKRWWLTYILKSPCALKEKVALMLHDRLASSCEQALEGDEQGKCKEHVELLRKHAFGNYKTLMKDITKDYLMLKWLNGDKNVGNIPGVPPDENYAREFLQLFTVGERTEEGGRIPLYTETGDIPSFARAMTGYTTQTITDQFAQNQHVVVYVETRHDDKKKTFWKDTPYEKSGNYTPEQAVDVTFAQRGRDVGRFVGGTIFATFCHDHPNDALLNNLSDILVRANFDLVPALRAVLKSEACFSRDVKKTRIKDPITYTVGFLKSTGLPLRIDRLDDQLELLGYEVTNPIDVFGWEAGYERRHHNLTTFWNAFATEYYNFVIEVLTRQDNDFVNPQTNQPQYDFCSLNPYATARSDEVVDHVLLLIGAEATASERSEYIRYLDNRRQNNGTEMPSLYDGRLTQHCRERLAGVLQIASLTPSALTY